MHLIPLLTDQLERCFSQLKELFFKRTLNNNNSRGNLIPFESTSEDFTSTTSTSFLPAGHKSTSFDLTTSFASSAHRSTTCTMQSTMDNGLCRFVAPAVAQQFDCAFFVFKSVRNRFISNVRTLLKNLPIFIFIASESSALYEILSDHHFQVNVRLDHTDFSDRQTFFASLFLEEMLRNRNFLFVVRRLAVTLQPVHRSPSIQSSDSLGVHMKQLNDGKRFKESLSLFDSREPSKATDLSINQALKACIHLSDFQRGLAIHKALSSRSLKCRHIQMSLVQLYSASFASFERDYR